MKANERTDNLSQASPSPEAGADDIDKGVASARVKHSAVTNQGSKPTASFVVDTIQKRIKYYEEKSLTSGWTSYESGPCCEKCAMRTEHFTGRADALKAIVGCRNPFQLESVCQCHIPVRRAVIHGITNALSQLVSVLGDNAEEFRFSGGVSDEQSGSQQASPDLLETERERVEKAFGGCKICYGKGYSTVRKGNTYHGKTYDMRTHINYCTCDRGKQLREVIERLRTSLRPTGSAVRTEAKHEKGEPSA